jgi:hypothetical protein
MEFTSVYGYQMEIFLIISPILVFEEGFNQNIEVIPIGHETTARFYFAGLGRVLWHRAKKPRQLCTGMSVLPIFYGDLLVMNE